MNTGGYAYIARSGATRNTDVEAITRSLVANKGVAYDDGSGSLSWLECHAIARAIAAVASSQRRFANQFDPTRMTDALPRWERIFGIPSPFGRTLAERRREVAARFAMIGRSPHSGDLTAILSEALPDNFSELSYTTSSVANTHTTTSVTVPGGITTTGDGSWSSSIYFVAVGLIQPAWQTDVEFARVPGVVHRLLDGWMPAWCTFDWYRDGVNGAGFYLDEDGNLNNQRFD